MLSNRDTSFDEDGWALALDDLRRHDLLLSQGSNDLNAAAVDANQTSTNLSDGLAAHVAAANPHPQYQLIADAGSTIASVMYYDSIGGTSFAAGGGTFTFTNWSLIRGSGLSGFDTSSGTFTAPSDGIYLITANAAADMFAPYLTGGSYIIASYLDLSGSAFVGASRSGQYTSGLNANATALNYICISGTGTLAAGQQIQLTGTGVGSTQTTINEVYITITKLG